MYKKSLTWFANLAEFKQQELANKYYGSTVEYLIIGQVNYIWIQELL